MRVGEVPHIQFFTLKLQKYHWHPENYEGGMGWTTTTNSCSEFLPLQRYRSQGFFDAQHSVLNLKSQAPDS